MCERWVGSQRHTQGVTKVSQRPRRASLDPQSLAQSGSREGLLYKKVEVVACTARAPACLVRPGQIAVSLLLYGVLRIQSLYHSGPDFTSDTAALLTAHDSSAVSVASLGERVAPPPSRFHPSA